ACYYILGEKQYARLLLNKFKWGHTFLELNHDALEDYSAAEDRKEIVDIESQYFGNYVLENEGKS
ncbi:MAG: DUF367 domain-containing protein, partial [Nitrososphaeraceae archaeon]|nr:DUF367 domain-containing protein [Nitrososphaeraceae archaeon]